MVDAIPARSSIAEMWQSAGADGRITTPEVQAIYARIVSDGVTPEELSAVRGIVAELRAHPPGSGAWASFVNYFTNDRSEHANALDMATRVLQHVEAWNGAVTSPPPSTGTVATYQAYYAGVVGRLDRHYPNTEAGIRRLMSDVAHSVTDRFPPGTAGRAEALGGAYAALCSRFFEHCGNPIDYSRMNGHGSTNTNPLWREVFARDGTALNDGRTADGLLDTDCKGFALLGEYFFREAGVPAADFHYQDVLGATAYHRIAYVSVDGHTVGMSNGEAAILADHSDASMVAWAIRQTHVRFSSVHQTWGAGATWLPLSQPPRRT